MMTWKQRLDRAEKRGQFTKTDIEKSLGWCTCPWSEKVAVTHVPGPIIPGLQPLPHEMTAESAQLHIGRFLDTGTEFYNAVTSGNVARAKEIYGMIQRMAISS